jgi:hypothetical protein
MFEAIIGWVMTLFLIGAIIAVIYGIIQQHLPDTEEVKRAVEEAKLRAIQQEKAKTYGANAPAMICPHCQEKGTVWVKAVKRKKGVSGAKLTAAALTVGISMLGTGLSRKEELTQAHCENCGSTWDF